MSNEDMIVLIFLDVLFIICWISFDMRFDELEQQIKELKEKDFSTRGIPK